MVVHNQSTARHLQLSLGETGGNGVLTVTNKVRDIDLPQSKVSSKEMYVLTPGTYLLTEASHPAWNCKIIVTPN